MRRGSILALIVGALVWLALARPPRLPAGRAVTGSAVAAPPDLVLVINVDTLRRDRLGVYGNTRRLTPAIDAIGRDGLVFDWAFAASNHTRPSVSSLMTGVWPSVHGFWRLEAPRDLVGRPSLAGLFHRLGYTTAFITANPNTPFATQFDRAWADRPARGTPAFDRGYVRADETYARAWQVANAAPAPSRLFLYVQPADPHPPYEPPVYYPDLFEHDPIGAAFDPRFRMLRLSGAVDALTPAALANVTNRYDAAVRYLDGETGRFVDRLLARYPRALVIITSDHGEAFLEHGDVGHATSLYDTETRIPLIVRDTTGRLRQGGRERALVSNVDVLPFLAEYFDATSALPRVDGRSFLGHVAGPGLPQLPGLATLAWRDIRIESVYPLDTGFDDDAATVAALGRRFRADEDPFVYAVVRQTPDGVWKGISGHTPPAIAAILRLFVPHHQELYDLVADPGETVNRYGERLALARQLFAVAPPAPRLEAAQVPRLSPDDIDRLRSLGYVGAGGGG